MSRDSKGLSGSGRRRGAERIETASDLLVLLVQNDLLTASAARMARRFAARWSCSHYDAVLETALIDEGTLAGSLSQVLRVDRLYNLQSLTLALNAIDFIDYKKAKAWVCLPVTTDAGGVEIVMADPTQTDRIAEIKQGLNLEFALAVAGRSDIVRAIDELYPLSAQLPSLFGNQPIKNEEPPAP